ncbi:MAG: DNA translocase FtsK 4TM domain-containing protein, partial [Candidatus Eisenbacteria bacterium]
MKIELSERRRRHVAGVLLGALGLVVLASLVTYRVPGLGYGSWSMPNASGPLGAVLAHGLIGAFGHIVAFGVPLLLFAWCLNRLRDRPVGPLALESAFGSALALEGLALGGLFGAGAMPWAGSFGVAAADLAHGVLGSVGGAIVLSALFLVTGLVASEIGFGLVTQLWRVFVKAPARAVVLGAKERHAVVQAARAAGAAVALASGDAAGAAAAATALAPPLARSRRDAVDPDAVLAGPVEAPVTPEDAVP